MKARVISVFITVLFVVSMAFTLVQCDHDGMARVTINVKMPGNPQADSSIIDKLLNMFSTRAYAAASWNTDVSELRLRIYGPGMQTIETNIPSPYGAFTISVPEGDNRTFRLVSISADQGSGTSINFRGETTIDVTPGGNDINILMMPGTEITAFVFEQPLSASGNLHVEWNAVGNNWYVLNANFNSYKLYTSDTHDGQFNVWHETAEASESESWFEEEMISLPDDMHYVKISITTVEWGEGVLSEAIPVEILD